MSQYLEMFKEAVQMLGFNKCLALLMRAAGITDSYAVGRLLANFNSGGVTDSYITKKV